MPFEAIISDAELWDGDMTARRVDGHDVLLVRHNSVVYAYENRCAHLGVALSEGRLDGHVLTCRAHHWQYDVRSGTGINPATACLKHFPVKIEDGRVFVNVQAPHPDFPNAEDVADLVGPVFTGHHHAQAVLEAIRRLNPSAEIHNRGSYIRVLVPRRCLVTRSAVEDILRQPFDFRAELEIMMPSFKGRMHLNDDEAVWTFEDGAISGATASPSARSHPNMIPDAMPSLKDTVRRSDDDVDRTFEATATAGPRGRSPREIAQKRTYWHLSELGRRPTDYDIATSRLHYWTARGFEVKVPVTDWYERYQRGSELRCADWEAWSDPRQTTYTAYTTMQRTREAFVNGLLDSISDDYDRGLSPQWVALLDRVLAPLRYPGHGLQMVAAYIGSMAPTARITIAATFQAADEMRRVQRLAYRMRQLQVTHPEFGRTARQIWQDDPIWQPLREVIETLLVTWDWGEALVALQFVVKPAFDELFMTQFGRLARAAGDDVLDRMFFSLNEDCAWHRAWSESLMLTAIRDRPESALAVKRWIETWTPRVSRAVSALQPIFDETSQDAAGRFSTVVNEIEQFGQRWRGAIFDHRDLSPGGSVA
ncbi:MAG TPA: MmoB/DmpM family protein [Candidatus Angelobacter sp.]|nr:MmoB/DmpM family protein [Candidatus Angelobacter sp.]